MLVADPGQGDTFANPQSRTLPGQHAIARMRDTRRENHRLQGPRSAVTFGCVGEATNATS